MWGLVRTALACSVGQDVWCAQDLWRGTLQQLPLFATLTGALRPHTLAGCTPVTANRLSLLLLKIELQAVRAVLCVLVPDLLLRLEEEWDERRRLRSTLQGKGPAV